MPMPERLGGALHGEDTSCRAGTWLQPVSLGSATPPKLGSVLESTTQQGLRQQYAHVPLNAACY